MSQSLQPATEALDLPTPGAASGKTTRATTTEPEKLGVHFDYFLDCVHCGLCTAACPTYLETGDENNGPRGRIYLMRQVAEGKLSLDAKIKGHLDLCLDCRSCETACPSGVQYGRLIEPFRLHMEETAPQGKRIKDDWFARLFLFRLFPYASRLRWAIAPARWAQKLGLLKLFKASGASLLLPPRLRRLVEMLPASISDSPPLPERLPARGRQRARVALFTGCVADAMQRNTHWATARVLQANGCEVLTPRGQTCCGAIHFHAGQAAGAHPFAQANAQVFSDNSVDAVIVNVAGCGAMMKEYPHHWPNTSDKRLHQFAAKVKDVSEFLNELGATPTTREVKMTAVYHDACHLGHAQRITAAPRQLLSKVAGLRLVEMREPEICCGAAGTYNLQHPEMAERLGMRKLKNILSSGANTVITSNVGCILQIQQTAERMGEKLQVLHIMDVLDKAYQ